MSGRFVVIGLIAVALLIGALMWWALTRAYFREVAGVETVEIGAYALAVADYRGIDADASPLNMRGCFAFDPGDFRPAADAARPLTEAFAAAGLRPTPLIAPGWFDCFDARRIDAAIEAGEAAALVAVRNEVDGFDRLVALWPDGRGVTWRQLNEVYSE